MIVVDASALIDLLIRPQAVKKLQQRLLDPAERLHAPHLLDVEVIQVIRRFARNGDLDDDMSNAILSDFQLFPLYRHSHEHLVPRMWDLRHNLTAYDAAYVALARGAALGKLSALSAGADIVRAELVGATVPSAR